MAEKKLTAKEIEEGLRAVAGAVAQLYQQARLRLPADLEGWLEQHSKTLEEGERERDE